MSRLRDHLTYANVMATIAVFIALGGVSWAAVTLPRNSVGNAQLRNGAVTERKLAKAVRTKLARTGAGGTTGAAGLGAQGPAGIPGPAGAQGLKGDTGAAGPPGSNATVNGIAAGGDLSGTYPNPQVAANALRGDDIDEQSLRMPGGLAVLTDGVATLVSITGLGTLTAACTQPVAGSIALAFTWTNTTGGIEEFVAVTGTEGQTTATDGATIAPAGSQVFAFGSSATANFGRSLNLTVVDSPNGARAAVQAGGLTNRFGANKCSAWASVLR